MTAADPAFVVPAGICRGNVLTVFGQTVTERIPAEDTAGAYCVFDEITPPGTGVPPHRHRHEDEVVLVRGGELEVFLNGSVTRVGAGAVLNLVRGSLHGFLNRGTETVLTTWVVTPGSNGQAFLRALAALPPGPPDPGRIDALHARHGITMDPPSLPWWDSPA